MTSKEDPPHPAPTMPDPAELDAKIAAQIRADLNAHTTSVPNTLRLSVAIDADLLHGFYRHLDLTGYNRDRVVAAALLNFVDLAPMAQYHMLEELAKWEEDGEAERTGVLGKIGAQGKRLK